MKQTLILLFTVAVVAAVSCGKSEKPSPENNLISETEAAPAEDADVLERADSILKDAMSMDDYEHKLSTEWLKHQIVVTGQQGKKEYEPDIKAIYDAIVEVFPLPMFIQWAWYGADAPGIWDREADIVCDRDNFFIGGEWKDPAGNFDDHFELKAWQVNAGSWLVGLNYQPLWDGDDGIGVYGRQLFWWYAPYGDATLSPIEFDEDHPALPQAGDPHFDREESTISYPSDPDPSASLLHFNGWWFEQW